ncbi:hypothetical protein DV495_004926 [Geotrichum candidum]|nr:hypothetical protein DV454_004326 [Geotrichum candidum]KAI9212929.1 hypothetical protein DS838_002191 [Geotrichum bryndzae]KAF5118224.1 hypothetical protein DV495_004926 [Geotrichum candidum]KAF5119896.1 hypothetical protein DV452_001413 [Geotrichum candidum]KAF7499395.1 hypothetical protein DV113_002587 [Geotrichum candidum]
MAKPKNKRTPNKKKRSPNKSIELQGLPHQTESIEQEVEASFADNGEPLPATNTHLLEEANAKETDLTEAFNEESNSVEDLKVPEPEIKEDIVIEDINHGTNQETLESEQSLEHEAEKTDDVSKTESDQLQNLEVGQEVVAEQVAKISIQDENINVEADSDSALFTESHVLPKQSQSDVVSDNVTDDVCLVEAVEQSEFSAPISDNTTEHQDQIPHRPRVSNHAQAISLNTKSIIPRKRFISTDLSNPKTPEAQHNSSFSESFDPEFQGPSYMRPTFASLSKKQDRHLV